MIIAIDLDEVLGDSVTPILNYYNKHHGGNLTEADLINYSYLGFLGETREEAAIKINDYNEKIGPGIVKPFPEAISAVKQLSKKHTLKILTSRPLYIKKETIDWVNKYFPDLFDEIIFNNNHSNKTYLPGEDKSEILKKLKADIFVEDILTYAKACPPNIKVFLLDKPWNQGPLPKNVIRAFSWQEIINKIE